MAARPMLKPGPDHPIDITPSGERVVVRAGGTDAVWTYESPYPSVAAIKDHLAFYPERVEAIERSPLD